MNMEVMKPREGNSFEDYEKAGGVIFKNEVDYNKALARIKTVKVDMAFPSMSVRAVDITDDQKATKRKDEPVTLNPSIVSQAKRMARQLEIEIESSNNHLDPRIALYGLLHEDAYAPAGGIKYDYKTTNDWFVFAETIRMLGDAQALQSLREFIVSHPISFPKENEKEKEDKENNRTK